FSSRRRHTRCYRDWSSDVCSSDLAPAFLRAPEPAPVRLHVPDRPQLDEAPLTERDLLRPLDRFLPGVTLDQVEAAQGLLRLGEGAIHDLALPGLEADAAGVAVRAQALAHDHLAGGLALVAEAPVALADDLHLGPWRRGE